MKRDTIKVQMSTPVLLWPQAERLPALENGSTHVVAWNIDRSPETQDWKILDKEETARAQRFVFPRDRDRFVCAHATLRRLLGNCRGTSAAQISFTTSKHGKPRLRSTGKDGVHFNLSHSGGIAVAAISHAYSLGVDIERMRDMDATLAEHHFSARELRTLHDLAAEDWQAGFFRCWTSKEALLKGEGMGLNLPLDAFDVEADPSRPPALLESRLLDQLPRQWQLFALRPATHTMGTLAVRNGGVPLSADSVQCFSLIE